MEMNEVMVPEARNRHNTHGTILESENTPRRLVSDEKKADFNSCGYLLILLCYFLLTITFPLSLLFFVRFVKEYERAVIFRLGRIKSELPAGPGLIFPLPLVDKYKIVDLRTFSFNIPPQEVLTRDSVTVSVDAVVFFRIHGATKSVSNVVDATRCTKLLAQTTVRNVIGTKTLTETLQDREGISRNMQMILDEATDDWGVKVERIEMKDVRLPKQLQRAMATEAEASREAKAKFIAGQGELNSASALKSAADIMHESPQAMQLRFLQTLTAISAEKNQTIVLPVSPTMLGNVMKHVT